MKVTDDMWSRFVEEIRDFGYDADHLHCCKLALEAALADVPARSFSADAQRALRAAEAKLEKVRELAAEYCPEIADFLDD